MNFAATRGVGRFRYPSAPKTYKSITTTHFGNNFGFHCKNSITWNSFVLGWIFGKVWFGVSNDEQNKQSASNSTRKTITYNQKLSGLLKQGKYEEVDKLFHVMKRERINQDNCTYNTLIAALERKGDILGMEKFFEEMKQKGCTP